MKSVLKYTFIISIIVLILFGAVFWASTAGLTFINMNTTNQKITMGVIVLSAVVAFVSGILTIIDWISRKVESEKIRPKKPFMVLAPSDNYIQRPEETKLIIQSLLSRDGKKNVGITTALEGAGGYGKTELTRAVCQDKRIKKRYKDGILWVSLGEHPDHVGRLSEIYKTVTGNKPDFSSTDEAIQLVSFCLKNHNCLLVIDDVWNEADLRPFLQVSHDCDRLITTRIRAVLPIGTKRVEVDKMLPGEAIQMLLVGEKSQISRQDLEPIAEMMGYCPLLLKLASGYLNAQIAVYHETPEYALQKVIENYKEAGVTAFDARNPVERNQAYAKSIKPSLDLLSENERDRFYELAIFPEDISIPMETVSKLWEATGTLDRHKCEELSKQLYNLGLLLLFDGSKLIIRLHDVIRCYLINQNSPEQLIKLNGQFLDSYRITDWKDLSEAEPYLWDYLADHLIAAGRDQQMVDTIKDLRYIAKKIIIKGFYTGYEELLMVEKKQQCDRIIRLLCQQFLLNSHMIKECQELPELEALLFCRLEVFAELRPWIDELAAFIHKPWIRPLYPLPDDSDGTQILTIAVDIGLYCNCAFSPDGHWIVSESADNTLRVWDAMSGQEHLILRGHRSAVTCCAFSPDGNWIVSGSEDKTLRIWDAKTGQERMILNGEKESVTSCAYSPDGRWIVSGSGDILQIWDAIIGQERLILRGHED